MDDDAAVCELIEVFPEHSTIEEILDNTAPVNRFLSVIMHEAIKHGATSMYFEKMPEQFLVREKVNGRLWEMAPPPKHLFEPLSDSINQLFGLAKERKKPQTLWQRITRQYPEIETVTIRKLAHDDIAYLTIDQNGRTINLNLNRLPNNNGLHIEIYDNSYKSAVQGFLCPEHFDQLPTEGIILLTSLPDGGKTTTAYQILRQLPPGKNIVTLEQKRTYSQDFASVIARPGQPEYERVLQSIRQYEPDVILFDDLTDERTAKEAIHYATSGKLVLAVLSAPNGELGLAKFRELSEINKILVPITSVHKTLKYVPHQRCGGTGCDDCNSFGIKEIQAEYTLS